MKVFLGGTCNESKWRDHLIDLLQIDYFNPVVEDWTSECQAEELAQRGLCDYCLYVITPLMTGVYSIAEVIDDSNKRPKKTIFCFLENDVIDPGGYADEKTISFTEGQIKSLEAVGGMVVHNGGLWLRSLESVAEYLNNF